MRKEAHALVQAVRRLRLALTGQPEPRCVSVGVPAAEFPVRLADIQRALETLDAADAADPVPTGDDAEKLRKGIDGVFRWIRLQGLDTAEPLQILTEALTGRRGKPPDKYEMLPRFTPYARRKPNGWEVAIGAGSRADHAAMHLGAVLPQAARMPEESLSPAPSP